MNHISRERWNLYVQDKLDQHTRKRYEDHMFTCDRCLELYIKAVESFNQTLPKPSEDFTEKIVEHVKQSANENKQEQKSKQTKSFVHYTIAAAMTIILMSSGLFGQLTQVASQFEAKAEVKRSESLTEQLLDKTIHFIQVFERNKEVD